MNIIESNLVEDRTTISILEAEIKGMLRALANNFVYSRQNFSKVQEKFSTLGYYLRS